MVEIFVTENGLPEPALRGNEAETFLGSMERMRSTFAWKFSGLTDEQMRMTVGASTMTMAGLVKHLALVEDYFAFRWLRGEPYEEPWNAAAASEGPMGIWDWAFRTAADDDPADLIALWQAAVLRARAAFMDAAADGTLDGLTLGRWQDEPIGLRRAVADYIEEVARHVGHADLLREVIDGQVGEDPPDGPVAAYPPLT